MYFAICTESTDHSDDYIEFFGPFSSSIEAADWMDEYDSEEKYNWLITTAISPTELNKNQSPTITKMCDAVAEAGYTLGQLSSYAISNDLDSIDDAIVWVYENKLKKSPPKGWDKVETSV